MNNKVKIGLLHIKMKRLHHEFIVSRETSIEYDKAKEELKTVCDELRLLICGYRIWGKMICIDETKGISQAVWNNLSKSLNERFSQENLKKHIQVSREGSKINIKMRVPRETFNTK